MSVVRDCYASKKPDGHWFDRGTMRFFKTKLPRNAYEGSAGYLFVTRETNPNDESRYSVRQMDPETGDVETCGEFHKYRTREAAMVALRSVHLIDTPDNRCNQRLRGIEDARRGHAYGQQNELGTISHGLEEAYRQGWVAGREKEKAA